ncbi:hypothetical protein C1H46_024111 [Malus baccata]|uniref:Uncharacterized protein n=1 Tax=Malus baccata TaxID=106549 RepID=A0A540LV23_MALBA|nr:hypothetical protein C1H46_024111 [Malus baccata]
MRRTTNVYDQEGMAESSTRKALRRRGIIYIVWTFRSQNLWKLNGVPYKAIVILKEFELKLPWRITGESSVGFEVEENHWIAEAQRLSVKFLHPYPTTVLYYLRLGKFEVFKYEEEFGMPPVFVESQRWRETSSSSKEVVYHPSVLADEQAMVEE